MAFRCDTENRDLPSSAELTEIAVAGYDYALRYETDSYDEYPFSDDISVTLERRNRKDVVEAKFSEKRFDEVFQTVEQQKELDSEKYF